MQNSKKPKDLLYYESKKPLQKTLYFGNLHYHLKPGGVKSVMYNTLLALSLYSNFKKINFDFLGNIKEHRKKFGIFALKDKKIKNLQIKNINIPEMRYDDTIYRNKKEFLKKAEQLKNILIKKINLNKFSKNNPYILHAHNMSLGKSTRVTAALKLFAESCFTQKKSLLVINQIHDFAENSRPDRLKVLQNCTGRLNKKFAAQIMYPHLPNIIYVVINSYDLQNLLDIGIDANRIFILPNSVNCDFLSSKSLADKIENRKILKEEIKKYADKNGYLFNVNKKILLVPSKIMRRKNIAENLLILKFLDDFQLLITLDAYSPEDIKYSNKIKEFIKKNKIYAVIGFGEEIISKTKCNLVDFYKIANAIITTSLIEGFGFSLIEGWLSNTLVIGRKIPYVTNDFTNNGLNLKHLYNKVNIKINLIDEKKLYKEYEKKINKLRKEQGYNKLSPDKIKKLVDKYKIYKIDNKSFIDFGDLSLDAQLKIINKINKNEFLKDNKEIKKMIELLNKDNKKIIGQNKKVIKEKYSLEAKEKRLENLFRIGRELMNKKIKNKKINNKKVIEKYLSTENIRLLY